MSCFGTFTKESRFADLVESVRHCDLCTRLRGRTKVLSRANGSVDSRVLFVAEAPGRLGADRTGVPLCGDRTGENFEMLLGNIGWHRGQVFITNAVLCNPREQDGNNATPTIEEIENCSAYLEMVVTLVQPDVVVSLGASALKALGLISPHGVQLQQGVAEPIPWYGATLFPLYHPGPRASVHRSVANQRSDFMRLAKLVHPERGLLRRRSSRPKSAALYREGAAPLQEVARSILEMCGRVTYFKLTKLLYFVDLLGLQRLGSTVGSQVYLRQVDGPWPPDLDEALRAMDGFEVRRYFVRRIAMVDIGPSPRRPIHLDDDILEIIAEVCGKYGTLSNAAIKAAAYRSEPMQFILREERRGKDMRNKAVLYKNKAAPEIAADSQGRPGGPPSPGSG